MLFIQAIQSPAQLTRQIEFYNPSWSPDGRTLVFEATLDGKYSLYTIKADGTGLERLIADTANNEQPNWSRDGRRIVFSSDRAGPPGHLDLYVMNADGTAQTRLTTTTGGGYYQSSFSPDGNWIVFQGRPDMRETRDRVYVMRSDGSDGWRRVSDSMSSAEGPRWSADGRSITFQQVPYSKEFWNEMTLADMETAKRHTRVMTVRPDGSGLRALTAARRDDKGRVRSPTGRQVAFTKSVDGAMGLYVADAATGVERLVIGGPSAGPLGYLRTATLAPLLDTIDTYESPQGSGQIVRGRSHYVVRTIRPTRGMRWELVDTWYDSSGRETARQYARTASGALRTELVTVRAPTDSASMLVAADRVTAWVVPQGATPQLFDSAAVGERYEVTIVAAAAAKTHPAAGRVFYFTAYTLYGGSPVQTRVDSIRVVRRDTLYVAQTRGALPVLVLERSNGGQIWVDETTGGEVLSRGNAGPGKWWWHIRRGVTPPR